MRAAPATASVPVTPELVMAIRRPLEVALSPDGRRIAFTVAPSFRERGGRIEARLWLGDVDGEPVEATDPGAADGLPRFSPDGTRLAYASDRGHPGRASVWLHDGGELGSIAGSVEDLRWAPDGRSLLVLAADLGSDRAGAQSATKIREAGAEEDDPRVLRPAQHWRRLYLVDPESGDTREVSPESVNVFEFDWAGGDAVAVCTDDPSESAWYEAYVARLDLERRRATRVHTAEWQLQCARISDAGRVAWIEGFASDRAVVTGTVHVEGAGALAPELDVTWLAWANEETLWCAGWRRSSSFCGRLKLDGSYEELLAADATIGMRHQARVSPSADGTRVAAAFEGADEPPEVVLIEDGGVRPLTALNAGLAPKLRSAEWADVTWDAPDGLEIQGLMALPAERGAEPLPLVVLVHGGPTGTWSWQYAPYFGLPLLLASKGYATLLPNPRGSTGRGQEFARANLGDMGGGDLQDILAGVDALVRDGIVDDDRVAITGGSYGGFMASWAVTQTDRFAAAIPMAVVTDWTSFHCTTNIGQFDVLFLQSDPFDVEGEYPKRSPVFHARNASTPTLIVHGEDDLCTPLGQATELYNALVEAGVETELVIYPREGHGWTEREHQADLWRRVEAWLARHLELGSAEDRGT